MSRFRASRAAEELAIEVTKRLRESGFSTWRFTPDGSVDGPDPESKNASFIRESALEWLKAEHAEPKQRGSDWFLPHPIRDRRAEAGLVVCELEDSSAEQARLSSRLIDALIVEARGRVRDALAMDAFTEQLGETYEYTALLYRIGRKMGSVDDPQDSVQFAIQELVDTADFGWGAAVFCGDGFPWLKGTVLAAGDSANDSVLEGCGRVVDEYVSASQAEIVGDTKLTEMGLRRTLGRQVLLQPIRVRGELALTVVLGAKGGDDPEASSYDTQVIEAVAGSIGTLLDTVRFYREQEEIYLGVITSMTSALDAKDRYTRGHSERVAALSKQLALASGADANTAERIYISGLLHDIGKIGVPERILSKQGRLTEEEFDAIKRHPVIGHQILHVLPGMGDVLPGVLHHHERWDGGGYPHGLSRRRIPWMARVMALADTFDAMSSNRSYRSAMSRDRVLQEIRDCSGTQFDPDLASMFLKLDFTEFDRLMEEHRVSDTGLETGLDTGAREAA